MATNPFSASEPSLGFASKRLPHFRNDRRLPLDGELAASMVDRYLDSGYGYFDTAYTYGNGDAERCLRQALVRRHDRDEFTLADKLPCWRANSPDDLERQFELSCRRCGVDYFDVYLLQDIDASTYSRSTELGAWELLDRLKDEGRVRRTGFSFSGQSDLFNQVLTEHPEVDVVQLQVNYMDWDDDEIQSGKNYRVARQHNKPVIISEPLKGGGLAEMDERIANLFYSINPHESIVSLALRFVGDLEGAPVVISSASSVEQLDENIATFHDLRPLSSDELNAIDEMKKALRRRATIPCTNCNFCTKDCLRSIDIPEYLRILNLYRTFSSPSLCQYLYDSTLGHGGLPKDCLECGQCETICPEHLDIMKYLKEVDRLFG
jgi:predicted aldo/keto reductase-like oxidoreductase